MHILHIIASLAPRYGGPSHAVQEMAAALVARGHEVQVLTTDVDGPSRMQVPLATPLEVNGTTLTYYPVQTPRAYALSLPLGRAIKRAIQEADVVHVHSLYLYHTMIACHYCRMYGKPYIIRPHGTLNPWHRNRHAFRKALYHLLVEQRNLDRASGVHCTSEAERLHVAASGVKAPLYVIPNCVDVDEFRGADGDDAFAINYPELDGRKLVTFLGRLTAKKRLDVVLDGFASAAGACDSLHLVLAGHDDEGLGSRLRTLVVDLGLGARVSFVGPVSGRAKASLLRSSLAFLLPSEDENFGVAVVEAMAAGTAVVVSRGLGIHDQIAEADAGLVIESTPSAVGGAILQLAADCELASRLGANGRRLAETTFSRSVVGQRLEGMYRSVRGAS